MSRFPLKRAWISLPCALLAVAVLPLGGAARAGDLRNFGDAALHAVQFVDRDEGWAVGDDGVVWHTIDAGRNWERQPTGVRASLRSVHFLTPYTGWIAGREELPGGAGSSGVLLFTQDGGLRWRRVGMNALPGLNCVRFLDNKTGFAAGDGSDQYPSGVFATTDDGRSWQPVPGPRSPGWLAADFTDKQEGALGGTWSRLTVLRDGNLAKADVDLAGGRSVRGLKLGGTVGIAVGEGGLVLLSSRPREGGAGAWRYADLRLPTEVRAAYDFRAVHCVGNDVWVVGRPGSAVLHSKDGGETWEILITGQPLPLNGVFFADERRGWAVGEFGSILGTQDGGKTWKVQRRGGQRAAVLFVHARPSGLPLDTIALLGGQEGYLAAAVRVNAVDPESAAPQLASDPQRFGAAMRQAGGAAGEVLWQFPMAQHLDGAERSELLRAWNRLHADRAAEELLRQVVLALRTWRPSVVITDSGGRPSEALVAAAVKEAAARAADPRSFPEQIQALGLEPWQVVKLYGCCPPTPAGRTIIGESAPVVLDVNEICHRLRATPRDFVAPAAGLLACTGQDSSLAGEETGEMPAQRCYRLLDSRLAGTADHRDLMWGILLAPGGAARRELAADAEPPRELIKAIEARRNLQALVAPGVIGSLSDANQLIAQVGPTLANLPGDQAPAAAFAVAGQLARNGQWELARELFLLMGERYPGHPLTADAYRWLIRYQSSSEARRRRELNQFLLVRQAEFRKAEGAPPLPGIKGGTGVTTASTTVRGGIETVQNAALSDLGDPRDARKGYQDCLDIGSRLAAFGPVFAAEPPLQFCTQSARRNLGDFEKARAWYAQFRTEHPDGPWHDAAEAELWLATRVGRPPKPVASCHRTVSRPFLDGKFDDPCWRDLKPLVLRDAVGKTDKDYPTEAWLAYDREFLYLALRCRHPADRHVAPVKARSRDADLRSFDHVSLLLDLDRDYATYFRLEVDQRGCVCEDCWGDRTWNPHWFVAVHSEPAAWQIEAAIPLAELTGDPVTVGRAWCCNLVRVLPGRGVQAWSVPADVQPRPEGMGLMMFTEEVTRASQQSPSTPPVDNGRPVGSYNGN